MSNPNEDDDVDQVLQGEALNRDTTLFNTRYGPIGKATSKEIGSTLEITLDIPISDLFVGKENMAKAWGLVPDEPIRVGLKSALATALYPAGPTIVDYLDVGTAPRVDHVSQGPDETSPTSPNLVFRQLKGIIQTHLSRLWKERRFSPSTSRENSRQQRIEWLPAPAALEPPFLNEYQQVIYSRLVAEFQLQPDLAREAASLSTNVDEALSIYIMQTTASATTTATPGVYASDPQIVLVPYKADDGLLIFVADVLRATLPILNTMCPVCGKLHNDRDVPLPMIPAACNEPRCQLTFPTHSAPQGETVVEKFSPATPQDETVLPPPAAPVAPPAQPELEKDQKDAVAPEVLRRQTFEVLSAFGSQHIGSALSFFDEFPLVRVTNQAPDGGFGTNEGHVRALNSGFLSLVRHTPTGQLALAKVVDLPSTAVELRLLAVDLATKSLVSPTFADPRVSLSRLLAVRHSDTSLCVVMSILRTSPIPNTLQGELQLAYPKITATNLGFSSSVEDWATNGIIPSEGLRPYIVLKQLLQVVARMHKAGLTVGNITPTRVIVGLQFTTGRDCDDSNTLRVEEKWSTMLIDLSTVSHATDASSVPGPAPAWVKKLQGLPLKPADERPWLERVTGDIWDCGVIFATLLFGENPFASHLDAGTRDWPTAPRYERRIREARQRHGMLWEPLLMRLLPEHGNQVACPTAAELLQEPLLNALTGDYTHTVELV